MTAGRRVAEELVRVEKRAWMCFGEREGCREVGAWVFGLDGAAGVGGRQVREEPLMLIHCQRKFFDYNSVKDFKSVYFSIQ